MLLAIGAAIPAKAATPPSEEQVKAAILFNLARFSQWSETAKNVQTDNFKVCISSNDVMANALASMTGKTIHNRNFTLSHIDENWTRVDECAVLYLSAADTPISLDLDNLHSHGILTIGDSYDFIKQGGCMSIQRHGKKLKFSINTAAMKSANIRPSSKILTLAVGSE